MKSRSTEARALTTLIPFLNQISTTARGTWFSLLLLTGFILVTVWSIEDADFFKGLRAHELPILNTSVPTKELFLVSPLLLLVLHTHLHLQLIRLWKAMAFPNEEIDGLNLEQLLQPWQANEVALYLKGGHALSRYPYSRLSFIASALVLWWVGPTSLAILWWRSMPGHYEWLTAFCGGCLFFSLAISLASWRAALFELKYQKSRGAGNSLFVAGLVALFGVIGVVGWVRTEGIPEFPLIQNATPELFGCPPLPLFKTRPNGLVMAYLGSVDFSEDGGNKFVLCAADLRRAFASNANLSGRDMPAARFTEAYLPGAAFTNSKLWYADLSGAHLRHADLEGAELVSAVLKGANLEGSNLDGAVLWNSVLDGANLTRANASRADFSGVSLRAVDFNGANLDQVILSGADLRDAVNLRQEQLSSAVGDFDTRLPNEIDPQTGASLYVMSCWTEPPAHFDETVKLSLDYYRINRAEDLSDALICAPGEKPMRVGFGCSGEDGLNCSDLSSQAEASP